MLGSTALAMVGLLVVSRRTESRPGGWAGRVVFVVAVAVAVGLVASPASPLRGQLDVADRLASKKEVNSRLFYWTVASRMIAREPLLGVGYHRFSTTFWQEVIDMLQDPDNAVYRGYLLRSRGNLPGEAHNEYIEIAAEMGLVGLAAFLGMVLWFGVSGWRRLAGGGDLSGEKRARVLWLMCALAVTLIDAMFSFPLQLPVSGIVFWTILALLRAEIARADPRAATT